MSQEDQKSSPASETAHVHGPDCQHGHESHEPFRRTEAKVGRNDPCTCGSGKKFKKCCGRAA